MGHTPPNVSVIVPCRNERDYIQSCVRSVVGQDPPVRGFEIIVVDGMSDDGTRDILENLATQETRLRLIDNPAKIVSTALNAGIRAARGNIIIRMDAHTQYAPDYIRQCLATLRDTGADNVGGPWIAAGAGLVSRAIAAAFQSPFGAGGARGHDATYEGWVDTVYLGCWPREVFERIGFFDEQLVRNQDDEFNLRLIRAGGKIWQSPRIKSWYIPRASLASLFMQYVQYGYWKVRVIQKHKIPASVRHLVPGAFVLSLVLLSLLVPVWATARSILLVLVGTYAAVTFGASLVTARNKGYELFPMLMVIFVCFHVAYGYGFVRGICDFVVRKKGGAKFTALTRNSADPVPQQKRRERNATHR
jgi:glycosyltransferase involved in cell wall biosynthesis